MLDLIFFSYRQAYDEKSISKTVFSKIFSAVLLFCRKMQIKAWYLHVLFSLTFYHDQINSDTLLS